MLEGHAAKFFTPLPSFSSFHLGRILPLYPNSAALPSLRPTSHSILNMNSASVCLSLIILFLTSCKISLKVHIQSFQLDHKLLEGGNYIFSLSAFGLKPWRSIKERISNIGWVNTMYQLFHFCYVFEFLPQFLGNGYSIL